MFHLIRNTLVPWIAGLSVSFSGIALGDDAVPPNVKIQKRVRKVIVTPSDNTGTREEKVIIVQPHDQDAHVQPHVIVSPRRQGAWQPGGYEGRIGSPYYYSVPGGGYTYAPMTAGHGYAATGGCRCGHNGRHHAVYGGSHFGHHAGTRGHWYGGRVRDPYTYHFGPGYYRHSEHGHYRFPYYSYRRPWYYPGQPVFNRDTNFAW